MPNLYLTPASIGYLSQFILSLAISTYLLLRFRMKESLTVQTGLLTAFFVTVTLFLGLLFLDTALLPTPRLVFVYLENTVLALALVFLLQFAFRFPTQFHQHRWGSRLVLVGSLAYLLYEALFAAYRFYLLLGQAFVEYRPSEADYALAVLFVCVPLVFLLQSIAADERPLAWYRKFWKPQGLGARGARTFAQTFFILLLLSVVNILRGFSFLSTETYNSALSVGILLTLWMFSTAYLNYLPEDTSFQVKLSCTVLTLLLAILGQVGWVIAPASSAAYHPIIQDHKSLLFTPNASGGYTLTEVPFVFETDLGTRLSVTSRGEGRNQAVAFSFPLYGKTFSEIDVTSVGLLSLGKKLNHPNLQNDYGTFPGIFPLLVDLEPARGGGVYARQEPQRLIVTWDHLSALSQPEAIYTFQTVLYSDGRFTFTYNGLPAPLLFGADASPSANPWLRGVTPGLAQPVKRVADLSGAGLIGSQGVIQDFHLDFRGYANNLLAPLAWLILLSGMLILIAVPFLIRSNIVRPLDSLLNGVARVQTGDLNVEMPVHFRDEIGFLTVSFNSMVAQLREHVTELEARVSARTQELQTVNAHLLNEIDEREAAEEQIIQQQRELAIVEEREQLGRDLHDGLGQVMAYLNMETQTVGTLLEQGQVQAASASLKRMNSLTKNAYTHVRRYILGLRVPQIAAQNLFITLKDKLGEISAETELQTFLSIPEDAPDPLFSAAVEEQASFIITEALSNVQKHSNAHRVEVLFSLSEQIAQIIISDDGLGFDPASVDQLGHFGLNVMRERASKAGGKLELRSAPGMGTRVLVSLPRLNAAMEKPPEGDNAFLLRLRVLLVDDSLLFLEGMRSLLIGRGVNVVGTASDGEAACEQARLLLPDVIVMDVEMPRCNGLEATRRIKAEMPGIKIVMLTFSEKEENLFEAIRSGASGYMLKNLDADTIIHLLAGLVRGEAPLPPALAFRLLTEFSRTPPTADNQRTRSEDEDLTSRQWEVLQLVARGDTYDDVAKLLHISEATVKYHMGQILDRLHLKNREQAVGYAHRKMGPVM